MQIRLHPVQYRKENFSWNGQHRDAMVASISVSLLPFPFYSGMIMRLFHSSGMHSEFQILSKTLVRHEIPGTTCREHISSYVAAFPFLSLLTARPTSSSVGCIVGSCSVAYHFIHGCLCALDPVVWRCCHGVFKQSIVVLLSVYGFLCLSTLHCAVLIKNWR